MKLGTSNTHAPVRVLHTVSSLHVGGVGRMLMRNVAALESDGIRNDIAYLVPNHRLEAEYRKAGLDPICLDHRRTADAPRTLYRLLALIRDRGINIVHTNHGLDRLYGGLAAKCAGVPAITTAHDSSETHRVAGGRLRLWLDRQLLSQYIAVSAAVARACERTRGIVRDRVRVIYSGIEPGDFARPDAKTLSKLREQLGLHESDPILISVGRLIPTKNQRDLVPMMERVLKHWPRATLLVVGDGAEKPRLDASIAAAGLGVSIRLLGMRSDIRELLALSTIFVFPSESEGLPLAVLEAMSAGKPVIAAGIAPMDEVVEDQESGLLVQPRNPIALADGVDRLLSSPSLSLRMGRRGQEIVAERFSLELTTRSMGNLYRDIVAARC